MLIRFAILAPLSLLSRRLRAAVVGKYSGLQINPRFVRPVTRGRIRARLGMAGGRPRASGRSPFWL
jgi:hypothetical protein